MSIVLDECDRTSSDCRELQRRSEVERPPLGPGGFYDVHVPAEQLDSTRPNCLLVLVRLGAHLLARAFGRAENRRRPQDVPRAAAEAANRSRQLTGRRAALPRRPFSTNASAETRRTLRLSELLLTPNFWSAMRATASAAFTRGTALRVLVVVDRRA